MLRDFIIFVAILAVLKFVFSFSVSILSSIALTLFIAGLFAYPGARL